MAMDQNAAPREGGISVKTEHIFPVIKKWLYSEKEIFLRELVSNACDAVSKLKRLASLGEYEAPEGENYALHVTIDPAEKTITVSDNGVGMSAEEVERYICNIALSGAADFIEKYEKGEDDGGIIGHFGLGFYSAFMVADTVEVISRSFTGAPTVHWICDEAGNYRFETPDEERERGTDVILHISDEGKEYLTEGTTRTVLEKYCGFLPVELYLDLVPDKPEKEKKKKEDKNAPVPLNDTHPLWLKNAADCTAEEYTAFYRKVFNDYREPLFQIHLNADYPLNFKGILYFPAIRNEYETLEGKVKLYYNQVFVADNLKEVIPEYLLMLRGVLDCPELPLNVSRSYLQNSGYVTKIASHITKKVAEKVVSLFSTERQRYEGFWDDIKVFVEYGAIRDQKFYDKVKSALLLKKTDGSFVSVEEYLNAAKETNENKIYYTSDKVMQAQYVKLFEDRGIAVVELGGPLDMEFISLLERENKIKCIRVDAETEALSGGEEEFSSEALTALFRRVAGQDDLTVKFAVLADEGIPALLNVSEEERRMDDMMKLYARGMSMGTMAKPVLVLNTKNSLIRALSEHSEGESAEAVARQLWALALLAQRQLSAEELRAFLSDSYAALEILLHHPS